MAGVVYTDRQSSGSLLYESMSSHLSDFLDTVNSRSRELFTDVSRGFYERASRIGARMGFDRISRLKERMDRNYHRALDVDAVETLLDLESIQLAKPRMRRYIMANPKFNKMYRDKQLSGWGSMVEVDISVKPEDDINYRHVVNGILIDDTSTQWLSEEMTIMSEYDHLSIEDKQDIMLTWEVMDTIITFDKLDPTSEYGTSLE